MVLEDGLKSSEMARNFITTAQVATELMEKSHKPEAKLIEQFHSLSIDTDNRPIPHIAQLSAGRHTTDLQMIETKGAVVEVEDEA
ncbi:MAG: hypothetical protein EHM87_22440 [Burkholderiales bacterium]|nr:MAG: hypothetical protein EHM87_22440 [Burkholderiales bacterium]